jgi:hypothetical protein
MNSKHKAGKPADKKGESLNPPTSNTDLAVAPVKASSIQTADQHEKLNAKEQELLVECETDIEKNLQGTFVLGYRLEQIRDQKLYRATHTTFASYCANRWDFSKTHANRLIQAHLCEEHLKSIKDVEVYVPTKESQVRYIADLKPEQQVKVAHAVFEAVGDKEASAGDFGEAREELFPKPKSKAKAPKANNGVADDAKAGSKVISIKFDTKLVSFAELKKRADHIYNIYTNPGKKQEALKTIGTLQRDLDLWADWQANQINQQEAA